jgi:SAM-dependent methyltransferase
LSTLKKDPRERFSANAETYARCRPSYPPALRDFLLGLLPEAPSGVTNASAAAPVIADIGCGTGISTRLIAGPGRRVIGIDPNREMLAEAERSTPPALGVEYRPGEATATGLSPASVALITVAQAFHWFDLEPTLAEFARILVPGGRCAAYWNIRDDSNSPFLRDYEALLHRWSSEYKAVTGGDAMLERLAESAAIDPIATAAFAHVQPHDREGFFGRVNSSSYVTHGIAAGDRPAFDREIDALFDRHARAGVVEFAYQSRVLAFEILPHAR